MRGRSTRARLRWGIHTQRPEPIPTEADLASTVYRQAWTYSGSGVSRGFDVLALDADHAKELGQIRLAETGDAAFFALDLTRNEPVQEAGPEYVQAVLKTEGETSWHARQEEYARRQALAGAGL